MIKQTKTHDKENNRKSMNKRTSDEFIYNPDMERYIGKRTGNYFIRKDHREHYDGFPRFSEYQSHRDTQSYSLAREIQSQSSHSINKSNLLRLSGKQQTKEPPIMREDPKIQPFENTLSSRVAVDTNPQGQGQFNVSTIKRRSSILRPSQMKSYKHLLNQIETDTFKSFVFNEEQIQSASLSVKKQLDQKQKSKKKKQHRVSFKQNPIQIRYSQQTKNSQSNKQPKQKKVTQSKQNQNSIRFSKIIKKQQQIPEDTLIASLKKNKQKENIPQIQFDSYNHHDEYYDDMANFEEDETQFVFHSESKSKSKMDQLLQSKIEKKQFGRKSKGKETRITDILPKFNEEKIKDKEKEIIDQRKQLPKKNPIPEISKNSKRQKKMATLKERNTCDKAMRKETWSKKQLQRITTPYSSSWTSDNLNQNSSSQRYPQRTRIKPVQFWSCEKVHYKAGRAIGIESNNINLNDLLQTSEGFKHRILVNFHNHDVEVDLSIPAKKTFQSKGVKDTYEELEVSIDKANYIDQKQIDVHLEDGVRNEKIKWGEIITIPSLRYFELNNKSKVPVFLKLKFKVKAS